MTKEELENYKPKGRLIGFPKEIIAKMLDYQQEQGTKRDINVFEKDNSCSLVAGGFYWDETKEGDSFWYEVICNKDFNLFFERYPKQDNQDNSQEFNLENYVPKGQLEGFPKEIIAKMLDYQQEQNTKRDVSVFEENRTSYCTGFVWNKTEDGHWFWDEVIREKNFNLFFKKYPKICSKCHKKYAQVGNEEKRNVELSFEQAKKMFESNDEMFKEIAIKNFPELKKYNFPKSWEEFCLLKDIKKDTKVGYYSNACGDIKDIYYSTDPFYKGTVLTKERAKNILLFQQLLEIRDYWNKSDNYQWDENDNNWCIRLDSHKLDIINMGSEHYLFAFKTLERAKEFAQTFEKELIQIFKI